MKAPVLFTPLLASLLAASIVTPAAGAAAPAGVPPGLYRIDSQATLTHPGARIKTEQQRDGASGKVAERTTVDGQASGRAYQGPSRSYCAQPAAAGGAQMPPGLAQAGCTLQSAKATADGWVHVAECRGSRTTLTAHRIDDNTWDIEHEVTVTPQAGPANMAAMRPMLENMAKNGTPEQRAKAAKALADLPRMQAQMSDKRTEAAANLAKARANAKTPQEAAMLDRTIATIQQGGIGNALHQVSRERWTRIALSCAAGEH